LKPGVSILRVSIATALLVGLSGCSVAQTSSLTPRPPAPAKMLRGPDRYESDNTTAAATTLRVSTPSRFQMHTLSRGDIDWFRVGSLETSSVVGIVSRGASVSIAVFDSQGRPWTTQSGDNGGDTSSVETAITDLGTVLLVYKSKWALVKVSATAPVTYAIAAYNWTDPNLPGQ